MSFVPRLDKSGVYNNSYWYSTANRFYPSYQLPNCTCYAYGRWLELGLNPTDIGFGNGDAQYWYPNAVNNGILSVSQTPALGAIACWKRSDGNRGHVAVVEVINSDGTIVVSQSGYQRPITSPVYDMTRYFTIATLSATDNYSIYGYTLQGFILPPSTLYLDWIYQITDSAPTITNYKENNAQLIYGILLSYGWCLESISAVIGNIEQEGILNPAQCEFGRGIPLYDVNTGIPTNIYFLPDQSANYGLGLCGWTQAPNAVLSKAYNENRAWYDGTLQCELINDADTLGFWIPTSVWTDTFSEFKTNANNRSVADLASAFCWEFERPASATANESYRRTQAEYWYQYLLINGPVFPNQSTNVNKYSNKMPVWMMFKRWF